MFGIDKIENVFDRLLEMERKHTRDYYATRQMMKNEQDDNQAESLLNCCVVEQAHCESLQYAQGLIIDMVKKSNQWGGCMEQKNEAMKRWRKEQWIKNNHN